MYRTLDIKECFFFSNIKVWFFKKYFVKQKNILLKLINF
jgi:hypothetical protein